MTFESVVLICQMGMLFFLAAWLTTGVYENIRFPHINSEFTNQVLDMTRLRNETPDFYATVSHRRISSDRVHRLLFAVIVLWELMATIVLWVGVLALGMSLFGQVDPDTARAFALMGAFLFTCTWAGFLVAGNWFCYWMWHDAAQNTHFQMTLWGVSTMVLIIVA